MRFSSRLLSRRTLLLGSAASFALFAWGCGNSGNTNDTGTSDTPANTNTGGGNPKLLTIISPHGQEIQDEFAEAFKAKNPACRVQVLESGRHSDLLAFVLAQFKAKARAKASAQT
jgi:ABC-type glycerol-3-phosphate transport system substrate-binding protein